MTKPKPVTGARCYCWTRTSSTQSRVCDFILTASALKLIARPVISDMILEEAERNVRADRPDAESATRINRRFDAVRSVVDGFDQPIPRRYVDAAIVNPKDQHVLAAALHHGAEFVVTNDARLRREITAWIAEHGKRRQLVAAISADEFATRLVAESRLGVESVVREMASRFRNPPRSYTEVVDGLAKSMPSLGVLAQ